MENTNQVQETQMSQLPVDDFKSDAVQDNEGFFQPVSFLTSELIKHGQTMEQATAWTKGLDSRADSAEKVNERIFFVNRALRLYMSEQKGRNHMDARMLVTDGLAVEDWKAIVVRGIVPWLLNKLPVSKNQLATAARAVSDHSNQENTMQSGTPE